jgi:hypothetical protein
VTLRDPRSPSVVVLLADGARPDVLAAAIDTGALPALARMRGEGATHTITSVFPSVTGPAYTPFLHGRHPGPIGLPALRWFDRARESRSWPHGARSYVGIGGLSIDDDVALDVNTIFAHTGGNVGSLACFNRGLLPEERLGRSPGFLLGLIATHLRGDVARWHAIDRSLGEEAARRIARDRTPFAFCAFTGPDKSSHQDGYEAPSVRAALRTVDDTVARLRADAERDGRWERMQIWVVSDHGHSTVHAHEDLERLVAGWGVRVLAHPFVYGRRPDIAVMVSGNAMAHLYVGLRARPRARAGWSALAGRWEWLAERLLARESVDLLLLPIDDTTCEVRSATRGRSRVVRTGARYAHHPIDGDPLGIGELRDLDAHDAWHATRASDYPDALVQLGALAATPRAGDVVISAAPGWDLRSRWEPIPHRSAHGALHREHMLVPLLTNHPLPGSPQRTVDVMPSALRALGLPIPSGLDGRPFV